VGNRVGVLRDLQPIYLAWVVLKKTDFSTTYFCIFSAKMDTTVDPTVNNLPPQAALILMVIPTFVSMFLWSMFTAPF
jgi:hypothetical protein